MNLISQAITLPQHFGITSEAEESRNELVLSARECASILDSAGQNSAVEIARAIRGRLADVEKTRKEIKSPLLTAGKMLDALAEDYTGPLRDELSRIERLVTNFQQQEQRRVAFEEEARQIAIRRLEDDRIEHERLARAAASSMTDEADLARALLQEQEAKASAEQAQAVIRAPLPAVAKASGTTTKQVVRWEVTDIRALYAARPELCRLESKDIAINATCFPEMPVPGLRIWYETVTIIRRA